MSAEIIDLATYRRAKTKRKRVPTCGACGQPGHYYRTCTDREGIRRWNAKVTAESERRISAIMADMPAELREGDRG